MTRLLVPPIKCQGIKSKLVPWIKAHVAWTGEGRWVEPFMGSGVVGFNVRPKRALFCDNNPYIIGLYREINAGNITPAVVRGFLEREGALLSATGKSHYYEVRKRFNEHHDPLDFLFLNRSCLNGVIRFNSKGGFNVPFGHKPQRFSKAYVTKTVNQVKSVWELCRVSDWSFCCQDFRDTMSQVEQGDFVYCDPPYAGRHTDYCNSWGRNDETDLLNLLSDCRARFLLSTWHSNQHRRNPYVDRLSSAFRVATRSHFYHVGARETNRKPMLEALAMNFHVTAASKQKAIRYSQPRLLEASGAYDGTE
jgi:DNA adenine methylase